MEREDRERTDDGDDPNQRELQTSAPHGVILKGADPHGLLIIGPDALERRGHVEQDGTDDEHPKPEIDLHVPIEYPASGFRIPG